MSAALLSGFDYRKQVPCALTRADWRAEFARVIESHGYQKFVAGDRTAFDARGRMLFEVYDRVTVQQ